MKDYTLYRYPLDAYAKEFVCAFKSDWTERQLDLQLLSVKGCLYLDEAFRLLEQAIQSRDWGDVEYAFEQARTYACWVFSESVTRMQKDVKVSTKSRQSGQKSKGAHRSKGLNWDAICHDYDKLQADGRDRPIIITVLARKYDIRKDVLNRGLRTRERGSARKNPE